MTELTNTGVIDAARKCNKMAETGLIGLALLLPVIDEKELWREAGYSSFVDFYQNDLKKSKSFVSKLMTVGKFALANGFSKETFEGASLTTAYTAITCLPDKDPEYVVATAQTNTLVEILANRRDQAFGDHKPDWETLHHCKTCGMKTSNPSNHA